MKRVLLVVMLGGCATSGASPQLAAARIAYRAAIEWCDEREREIVHRAGTTQIEDLADLAKVRVECDSLYSVIERVMLEVDE